MTISSKTSNPKRKIFIVDDHPIIRQGLAQLINQEDDLTICGEASDVPQAIDAIPKCSPDLTTIDISLGLGSGIQLLEALLYKYPDMLILVLSMHDESVYAERCLRAGARGYIMKKEPPEQVIVALRKVLDGEIYVSSKLSEKLLHKFVTKHSGVYISTIDSLSNRELEVFQFIGKGLKTREIAEQLNLSVKTIETYIDHIKKKMNFKDSRNLFMHAVQWFMSEEKK
ncbi:MAG: response regulator transcription factor [Nitrospirae bacterium]|nr:response regulator transcription factor [Nitrospirota bacterium]